MKNKIQVFSIVGLIIAITLLIYALVLIINGDHKGSQFLISLSVFVSNGTMALDVAKKSNRKFLPLYLFVATLAGISCIFIESSGYYMDLF